MAVAKLPLLGGVALTAAAIPTGLYIGSTIAKQEGGNEQQEPELISIKKADEFKENSDASKFGAKFSYFFLSATHQNNNKEWNRRATKITNKEVTPKEGGFFTSLKTDATGDKLKKACENQYKQTNFTETDKAEDWKEVWALCSLVGGRPTTIDESKSVLGSVTGSGDETGLATGSGTTKWGECLKTTVLSTYDPKNEKFWDLRNEEFEEAIKGQTDTNKYFKKTANKDVKTLCREIYKNNKDSNESSTNPSETDLKKWCSLDKSAQ